ncbi:MAG: LemA family protein [Bacteroidales bacterium]|jgi:LemA protein|nr:LemA family protein [Bacteroidales bacterium]
MNIVFLILGIVVVLLIIWIIVVYNRLIINKNRMHEAWSMIDVFLKKRYDLVPNLVEIVKGYSAHEKKVLEEVTRYRSEAMQAKSTETQIPQEMKLEKSLHRLLVVMEKYPDLKADQHFLKLQQQLSDMESDLEMARRYYNGTVRENNIYQESFPSNIIAKIFHFRNGIFFTSELHERSVPNIHLES